MNSITILTHLPLLLLFLFNSWQSAPDNLLNSTQYCNDHYRFCVKYPPSLLPHRQILETGEGITLKTFDESSIVTIRGSENKNGITPKELFETTLQQGEPASLVSSLFGSDYSEGRFLKGPWTYYQKSFFMERHYIVLMIKVPVNKAEIMPRLKEDVQVKVN